MDSVAVQMWAGDGLFRSAEAGKGSTPIADVGGGWTWSRCRGGLYEPSPVVSDERSPRTQMRAYRGEPYQAALRIHSAATDAAACNCRWSDAAGGAWLPCDATSSACPVGPTLGALGRCNRLREDATGNAAIQRDEQRYVGRRTLVCTWEQQRLPHWKRR